MFKVFVFMPEEKPCTAICARFGLKQNFFLLFNMFLFYFCSYIFKLKVLVVSNEENEVNEEKSRNAENVD